MRILAVSDETAGYYYDFYTRGRLDEFDLILSCGDLKREYLEFLVTMAHCPLVYVRGTHDGRYDTKEPLGCDDIDDRIYNFHGLRILGLGGSYRYRPGNDMYTEKEMQKRIRKLRGLLQFTGGFDILVTHAPCEGYGDLEDLPHKGFSAFNDLLEQYRPKYMFHGHVHEEYGDFQREIVHPCGTRIINACGSVTIDIDAGEYPEEGKTGSFFYDWFILNRKQKR